MTDCHIAAILPFSISCLAFIYTVHYRKYITITYKNYVPSEPNSLVHFSCRSKSAFDTLGFTFATALNMSLYSCENYALLFHTMQTGGAFTFDGSFISCNMHSVPCGSDTFVGM